MSASTYPRWASQDLDILVAERHRGYSYLQSLFPERTRSAIMTAYKGAAAQRETGPHKLWTSDDECLLARIWVGTPMPQILAAFPIRGYSQIKYKAHRMGLKRPCYTRNGDMSILLADNPVAWYWIGFLMADGSLNAKGLLRAWASVKDRQHIEQLATFLGTGLLSDSKRKAVGIGIRDKTIGPQIAAKYDIAHNKTTCPPALNYWGSAEHFIPFFIGFIDGDGTITKRFNTITIVVHGSWRQNLEQMGKWSRQFLGVTSSTCSTTKKGYALLRVRFNSSVLDYIRANNLPVIWRKCNRVLPQYDQNRVNLCDKMGMQEARQQALRPWAQ